MPLVLRHHAWTGTRWRPVLSSFVTYQTVRRLWPEARPEQVAGGFVWRHGGRIVAEVRDRGGWPAWQEWIEGR